MKYSIFKRLSNQAAASVTSGLRGCDWQLEYDKIFAELIVRECGEWVNNNLGLLDEEAKSDLLKHFGVEE
jgi:hypothetical protein